MKFDKVLDCYEICSKATECGTTGHQCEYGDDGCIDCVERLNNDLQEVAKVISKFLDAEVMCEKCPYTHECDFCDKNGCILQHTKRLIEIGCELNGN